MYPLEGNIQYLKGCKVQILYIQSPKIRIHVHVYLVRYKTTVIEGFDTVLEDKNNIIEDNDIKIHVD